MIKRRLLNTPVYLSAAAVLVVAIAVGLFLHVHHNKDIIPSTQPATSSTSSKQNINNNQQPPSTNSPPANSDKNPSAQVPAPSASGSELVAPYGTFVSDHHPSLSGANNTPSTELSTCTTTPGASCYIKFTKGDEVKKLVVQTTDGSGSTSWHWDVSQAGLSSGSWDITAVATLGSQTKTTNDTFKLEIQP